MFPFVRCFCGRPIGHLADAFDAMRVDAYREYFKDHEHVTPAMITLSTVQVDISHVFKALNIHTQCCKTQLMSQVRFSEYY